MGDDFQKTGNVCRRYIKKNQAVQLSCEWGECQFSITSTDKLVSHVKEHLQAYFDENKVDSSGNICEIVNVRCLWRDCNSVVLDMLSFFRHAHLHVFHSGLKESGRILAAERNLPICQVDPSGHNVIPDLPSRLRCCWKSCRETIDDPHEYYQHVSRHANIYPEGNAIEGCNCLWEECGTAWKSKHKLRSHLRSHTQEKQIACNECGSLFATASKFIDHLVRQSDDAELKFQCTHCNKKFATERLVKDHMRQHVNHYKCPYCEMTVPNPSRLRSHISYRHTNLKPFTCSDCNFSGKTASDLRKHAEKHTSAPTYKCETEGCNFKAFTFATLIMHFRRAHLLPKNDPLYQCHLCSEKFGEGCKLSKHLKKLHGIKMPVGHKRFRYHQDADGLFRLQLHRIESMELSELREQQLQDDDGYHNQSSDGGDLRFQLRQMDTLELPERQSELSEKEGNNLSEHRKDAGGAACHEELTTDLLLLDNGNSPGHDQFTEICNEMIIEVPCSGQPQVGKLINLEEMVDFPVAPVSLTESEMEELIAGGKIRVEASFGQLSEGEVMYKENCTTSLGTGSGRKFETRSEDPLYNLQMLGDVACSQKLGKSG